jgi:pimeloyl-ACP methyl ester carboxylesterase
MRFVTIAVLLTCFAPGCSSARPPALTGPEPDSSFRHAATNSTASAPTEALVEAIAYTTLRDAVAPPRTAQPGDPFPSPREFAAFPHSPLAPCRPDGVEEELLCGRLEVPEDRSRPNGRMISLNVVVVPALAADPQPDPYVEFIGSPGFAATGDAALYTTELSYFRQDRDVLLVDQRGTGGSNPLACEGVSGLGISELLDRWPAAAVSACRQKLAEIADLAKYTTADAADDMDAVRAWLGYEQINLFGGSYGSRAAQEYMRRYPERVRSAVLWGLVPPDFRRPLHYARDAQRGWELLLEECALDEGCSQAFPALQEDLTTVLSRLADDPLPVTFIDPATEASLDGTISHISFATVVWEALMSTRTAGRLPLAVHRAAGGDFGPFMALAVEAAPPTRPYFEGMHLSATCSDETLHIDPAEIEGEHLGSFMPANRVFLHLRACSLWEVERSSSAVHEPVRVDVPTLLITGFMDPVTPARWAHDVARHLPNAQHVVIRHMSHSLGDSDCADRLALAFYADPNPESISHPCVAQTLKLEFTLTP